MIILTDKMLVIPVGISPNYAGAGNSDIKLQTKEVTITENGSTTVVPDENFDVLTKVNITTNVNPALEDKSVEITSNGDYNYTASAPYYGIGNLNVKVNVEGHYESGKTVNPSFVEDVTVTPSEGFDAMSSVIVKKAVANLQDKTVYKASTSEIVLTADEGYQGLGTVTVAPIKTKTVSADPSTNVQEVNANTENNEYITSVTVNPVNTISINVDPSTNSQVVNAPENEYITSVTVNPVGTKTVTVDPSTNSQTVNANTEGNEYISTVTVNPVGTKTVTVDSSTNAQTVNANVEGNEYITSVTVNPVKTKSLSITPRLVEQTFTAEQELYKTVNVSAVKYTEKTYDASTNTQTYDYAENNDVFIKNLTINPVTSSIDPNIVPGNIAKGVSILGVEGTVEKFQIENSKTVNPSFVEDVTVTPSEGFDAMSSVIVKKAVANLQDKTVDKASTSQIVLTADEGYQGLGTVTIAPIKTTTHTVIPSSNQQLITADTNNNEYISEVIVNGVPQKTLTADPSTNEQTFNSNHSSGEFYSTVVVNPVTSSIDSNIVPENIAKGVSILGVTGNLEAGSITPTEAYAIRPTSGRLICPLTNVLLNETSWVSLDFSMDTSSLNKEKTCLFGISASSLHCYLNNGVLHMYTGEEVPMNKQITLDTNKHTLEFGFVSKADASGHANFKVVFDGEVVAEASVLVPTFNLPLSLFDIALSYNESYESYLNNGGITHIVNGTGYGAGDSVFDLFALTVYDKPGYYRQTLHAYTPSLDAGNKPIFIDNITGEYQYPASGTYSYAKIDGDTRTEIASATYTMPFSNDFQYFIPAQSAIIPTDIKLPEFHYITMYVKDINDFTVETDTDYMSDEEKRNIIRKKVMIGAQDEMIAPFNHADYERNIWGFEVNDDRTAILADASGGIYYKVDGNDGYSIDTAYGGAPQKLLSFNGEHIIKCGMIMADKNKVWKYISIDSAEKAQNLWNGIYPGRLNDFKFAPLCIFGTYNLDESKTPDDVISLGYQEALNQIGCQTGVRYAVKQIDIEECYISRDGNNVIDKTVLRHRLVTHTDNNGVNCLFDTITGTPYYTYYGPFYIYTGPSEPEPPIVPDVSILTDTYIRPSAGVIVPTDIKLSAYTLITMDIKDIDNFDEVLGSDVTGQAALDVVKSRVMLGAQPNILAPFNHIDYERSLPGLSINNENTGYLGDSSIGLYFGFGPSNKYYNRYSLITEYGGTPGAAIPSLTGEHTIKFGLRRHEENHLWSSFIIDNQPESHQMNYGLNPNPIDWLNNATKAPICIFGTYNLDESKTADDVIAMGYQNALNQIGYTTGVRFGVKKIEIKQYNNERILTEKYSLVPARDKDGIICLYDEVNNKSYYPYNGTLDEYTGPVEPEPPVPPTILTNTYVKPSADAIVPTDIKFTSLTNVTMHVKGFDDFNDTSNLDTIAMIGAQPNFIVSPSIETVSSSNMGIYFNGGGNVLDSTKVTSPQRISRSKANLIRVGYKPINPNNIIDAHRTIKKIINFNNKDNDVFKQISIDSSISIYKTLDNQMTTPICIFGNYNNPNSMTPDDVIALGYENALNQIGYVTGTRYGLKQIDITVYNTDGSGSMTTTHSLVPARDSNGTICLYDTITEKSYYPFHGTLDII